MLRQAERRGAPSESAQEEKRFLYKVYGLTVESQIELPELVTVENRKPQVQIRFGEVPSVLDHVIAKWPWCMASHSEFLFNIAGVASYHIIGGKEITIERQSEQPATVPAADIRLWLLGTAFAALLHQRDLLPLHVSAVKSPSGVWAFTGQSGEGKSTLAGFLHRRFGYELVSDDVAVIDSQGNDSIIYPGPRKLKLWNDAMDRLNFNGCKIARDLSNTDKFQIYLNSEGEYRPEPLHSLIVLESSPDESNATVERLHGIEAFNIVFCATYRFYMTQWFRQPECHMAEIASLCQQIRIYRFRRPRCVLNFESNLEPLVDLITQVEP